MKFTFDVEELRPLIQAIVEETVRRLEGERATLGDGRLAFSEEESARMLGLNRWQLRDERRRGRIGASRSVGRRVLYSREDLARYLAARRVEAEAK
jgi:hypothetical protein